MTARASAEKAVFSPTRWQDVCAESDLTDWMGVAARVDGIQMALFRAGATIHALGNLDPFSGANVIARGIVGDIGGATVVASPVYKQRFRLDDGVCIEDPTVRLPVWPIRCSAGRIEVQVDCGKEGCR